MPLPGNATGRRSPWRWYRDRSPTVRIAIPFGLWSVSIAGAWTVLNEEEYAVALGLVIFFLPFGIQATRETAWSGPAKLIVSIVITAIALYSGAVILKKADGKPWSNLSVYEDPTTQIPQPIISPSTAPTPTPTQRPSPQPTSSPPSPPPSPSAELVYTHHGDTILLKSGERNLWILMRIYGYPGTRQVLDLEIQNLSHTEKVYFGSKSRPLSGVIEPNQAHRWQRINLEELYLQTDNPPVQIRVTCVFAREKV